VRLRSRLVLAIAFASLLPLGLLGLGTASVAYKQVLKKEAKLLKGTSNGMSLFVETWRQGQRRQLQQQSGLFELDRMSEGSRETFLKIIYQQLPAAVQVGVYDYESGALLDTFPEPGPDDDLELREVISSARQATLTERLPVESAREAFESLPHTGIALAPVFGQPYLPEGRHGPVVPAVVVLPEETRTAFLGVEIALDELAQNFQPAESEAPAVALIDGQGRFVMSSDTSLFDISAIGPFLQNPSELRYTSSHDGQEVLADVSPIAGSSWSIVVASPVSISAQTAVMIRDVTGYLAAVAGVLCLLVGIQLARQLSGPVVQLKNAAQAVADGDLGREVEPEGSDEITELAHTFNYMSRQLREDSERIHEQQAEIEAFNAELQDRVKERTRELEEAHDQLLQSARLAAVGEMGAGLAHELNNPIAGILGMAQLLIAKADPKESGMLTAIEEQALRCKEIVGTLLGFSTELSSDQVGLASDSAEAFDLASVVKEVLGLVSAPLSQRGVTVTSSVQDHLIIHGFRGELGQAVAQLFTSICAVAPRGGRLHISGHRDKECIELGFVLEGPEIRFGSDDWKASGLGFWAARRVLATHSATLDRVTEDATPGGVVQEARWRVRFEVA
jgi:two-component system NtrC family sensor kinase